MTRAPRQTSDGTMRLPGVRVVEHGLVDVDQLSDREGDVARREVDARARLVDELVRGRERAGMLGLIERPADLFEDSETRQHPFYEIRQLRKRALRILLEIGEHRLELGLPRMA